jgi:tRNA-uridine 2-sulfurtransferase
MIEEYQAGRTPNPDIMCNQEVKFKLFLHTALSKGADYVATGHYARVQDGKLLTGIDTNKDQSYFLYRVTEDALNKTLFPLGEYKKPQVRELAVERNLITARKKESMGICFVGKVGIKEFLQNYVTTKQGEIIEQNGVVIGKHDGAIFYTIGQRHGLNVGGGLPYYVVGKDMAKNEVYVTTKLDDERLWHSELELTDLHWINEPPKTGKKYQVRTRYRAPLVSCEFMSDDSGKLKLKDQIKAVTAGQSAVIYDGDLVVGGGIVI